VWGKSQPLTTVFGANAVKRKDCFVWQENYAVKEMCITILINGFFKLNKLYANEKQTNYCASTNNFSCASICVFNVFCRIIN